MTAKEFNWQTHDGLGLFGREWLTEAKPKGVVHIVHGLGEHCGRYQHVAERLTAAQYDVRAFDLRGHGKSEGKRGHTPSYNALMEDIRAFLARTPNDRSADFFLYGHSLGGNLVLNFVLRQKPKLNGAVVTAPLLLPAQKIPPLKLKLGRLFNRLMPSLLLPNDIDVRDLSRDQQVGEIYSKDPLVHDRVSARLGTTMLEAGVWALEHAGEFSLPLLLMHGSDDHLTSPQASKEFAEKAPDCTFKLWDGFYHELHNEPEQDQVLSYIIDWLDAHC